LAKQTGARILAWSLLSNHVHLLLFSRAAGLPWNWGPEARGFPSAGQDRLDFESGVWDFAGGDSEAGRGLHFGNRQGHLKNGKAKVTGVSFQLRPLSQAILKVQAALSR